MAERTVYILLTRSGTYFSRLIHLATQDDYTHASIGLDGPAGPFYSFARKHAQFALPAGLVEETVTADRWAVPCCLYELQVSEDAYLRLRRRLRSMYAQREIYRYNLFGLLACWFHFPLRRRNHYFCSQFVAAVLEDCGAVRLPKDSALLRPADFCGVDALRLIHRGHLAELSAPAAV